MTLSSGRRDERDPELELMTMDETTRKELDRQMEALEAALRGEEVDGARLLPSNVEWAKRYRETLARLLNGASPIDA
jgi:hypothetical protein